MEAFLAHSFLFLSFIIIRFIYLERGVKVVSRWGSLALPTLRQRLDTLRASTLGIIIPRSPENNPIAKG